MQQGRKDAAEDSASDGVHAPPGGISKLIYVVFFFFYVSSVYLHQEAGSLIENSFMHRIVSNGIRTSAGEVGVRLRSDFFDNFLCTNLIS